MEAFFEDYLERLHDLHQDFEKAITGLPQEALDWVPGTDMNSLVVLIVHTTGATRFWVGDMAAGDPAPRDRAAEFKAKGLSEAELKARLTTCEVYMRGALERVRLADLATVRTTPSGHEHSVGWSLLHAMEHTGLHVGHAQLNRQLWDQRQS